jgi:hypothetical protein
LGDDRLIQKFVSSETNPPAGTVAAPATNVAIDIRSALLNEGFKPADVDKVVLDGAWDFAEAHRSAHRQLRPEAGETSAPGTASPEATTPTSGTSKSGAQILLERAKKQKRITQVRLEPPRHELFHQALTRIAAVLGTKSDSETIFQVVTTYEVPPCAK